MRYHSAFIRLLTLIIFFLASAIAKAAPVTWQIVPSKSSLTFTATQNNAPVSGEFKDFSGTIVFDPEHLDASQIKITVAMSSVSTSYQDVADTLKTSSWFDIKNFPQAIYTANHFIKTGDNQFQADGVLTIRNIAIPTVLIFTLDKYTAQEAQATGSVTLMRTQFSVGTGEWTKTDSVKDPVVVKFVLSAIAQP